MDQGRPCCVLNCLAYEKPMHGFPKKADLETLRKWIAASGNRELLSLPHESLLRRVICHKHFEEKYIRIKGKQLFPKAVPTLCLPEPIDSSTYQGDKTIDIGQCNVAKTKVAECPKIFTSFETSDYMSVSPRKRFSPRKRSNVESSTILKDPKSLQSQPEAGPSFIIEDQEFLSEPSTSKVYDTSSDFALKEVNVKKFAKRKSGEVAAKPSLLTLANVTRKEHLSQDAKIFYEKFVKLRRAAAQCQKRHDSVKERLHIAEKFLKEGKWDILDSTNPIISNFIKLQLRNANTNKYQKTFTIEDKLFALSLFKMSAKTYRFLCSIFSLPSPETLRKVIRHIPIKPGICTAIFESLKEALSGKKITETCCILTFDEMSLDQNLTFSKYLDIVEGFADDGFNRKQLIADHVCVWMLKSVSVAKPWKQPVAFTFSKSGESWPNLVKMYKEIVLKCQSIGLKVVASVCDQGSSNCKAVQELINESRANALRKGEEFRNDIICIGNDEIVPLFDSPHLIKCIRNNLLTKNLKYNLDGKWRIAKWSHIETAYFIDTSSGNLRIMPKLKESHVIPAKIRKMRVSLCTQVFSTSVASAMSLMARDGTVSICGQKKMPPDADDTAQLIKFLDDLFDSVNGGIVGHKCKKPLRAKTPTEGPCLQEDMWNKAIGVIRTMTYLKRKAGDKETPVVLKNWIRTLEGLKLLRKNLYSFGFSKFAVRTFNQDCLENFFSQVRQHGSRNINPTCATFLPYFKSLLVNNFSRLHSRYSNCENDGNWGLLATLKNFIATDLPIDKDAEWSLPSNIVPGEVLSNQLQDYVVAYLAGYVTKHVLPSIGTCTTCSNNLLHSSADKPLEIHSLIIQKDIGQRLNYCSENFIKTLIKITNIVHFFLANTSHFKGYSNKIKSYIKDNLDFSFLDCEQHRTDILYLIVNQYCNTIIFNYFNIINSILKGQETIVREMDALQQLAKTTYKKKLKIKK